MLCAVVFLFAVPLHQSLCQEHPFNRIMQKAGQYYEAGKFFQAVTEAKRLLYFDSTATLHYNAALLAGKSLDKTGAYREASWYYTLAERHAQIPVESFRARTGRARCYIAMALYNNAREQLLQLQQDSLKNTNPGETYFYLGLTAALSNDWNGAAKYFAETDSLKHLEALCIETARQLKNPGLAMLFSALIPGSGQAYAGEYLNGALSLGWNALWAYTAISAFAAERIFDGAMVTLFLWARFYYGGIRNADRMIEFYNTAAENAAYKKMEELFKGALP